MNWDTLSAELAAVDTEIGGLAAMAPPLQHI